MGSKTIEAIKKTAFTGNPGDGKIFTYYLKQAVKSVQAKPATMQFKLLILTINKSKLCWFKNLSNLYFPNKSAVTAVIALLFL